MAHVLGIDIYRHSTVSRHARYGPGWLPLAFAGLVLAAAGPAKAGDSSYFPDGPEPVCSTGPITANVVAMDQVITYNRMGAFAPAGMIFALARDVFPRDHAGPFDMENSCASRACSPGNVMLRPDKRPRPLTLRVNEGRTAN